MKKKEDMIHKFIYTLILLALLFSSNLFAQQTNKRAFQSEKELLELFKHARFPHLFKPDKSMYEQQRLRLTDTGDSLNVRLISRCPFGPCFAVASVGSIAYFGNGGYLEIVDFSNPADPIKLGRVLSTTQISKVAVLDDYVYVADDKAGLHIINVSSPKNPQEVSYVDIYDEISDVVVSGNYAYITTKNGLQVIDISDPATPQLKGSISIGKDGQSVAVSGKYAYVVDMGTGLHVIDISDPTNPQEVSTYGTDVQYLSIALSGNYAYIADYKFGLRIIDISNPMNLKELGYINMKTTAEVVKVSDNYAYIASGSSGLQVIDVSNPTNPIQAGSIDTEGDAIDVALGDNYAFVADYGGLRVIDINNPKNPQEVGYFATGYAAYDMAFKDNHVYVADGSAGIFVIDISNPASPNLTSHFQTTFEAVDVIFVGNYLYVAGALTGLQVFNASNPEALKQVTSLNIGYAVSMTCSGNILYVAASEAGLRVVDVSNATIPREVGNFYTEGNYAFDVVVRGQYAYVADANVGLRVVDITSPKNPQEVGSFDTEGVSFGVAVSGNHAYLADGENGLRVIDITSPTNLQEVGYFDTEDLSYGVAVSGNIAYLADGEAGLRVIDVSNPETPQEMGYFDTGHAAFRIVLRDNYVYVADGFDGLYILEYLQATPNIALELTFWDYGLVPVGSTEDKTFVVSNSGEATLEVSGLSIVGTDYEQFTIVSSEDTFSVSPGDSQNIIVRFSPVSSGVFTATLQISSNDPDEEMLEIDLTGTGEAVTVSSLTKPNEQPGGSEQTAYRLVSIPLDLDDSSIESVLEDDLGSYDINEWRLFDYVDGQYIEYPDVSEFTPGRSLWLILKDGAIIDCGSGRLISDKYFSIPLDPGWNPIATPYNQSIPIENLSLTSGNELQLWYYNGWWDDYVESLEPWEGYGLLNDGLDLDTLLIYPDFNGNIPKANNAFTNELLDWWIQIEASCEQAKDPCNILGVSSQALSGWDRLDRGEPPAVGKYVTVYFNHPEWERVIHKYSMDCRPMFADGETWHFQVSSNMSNKEIELNFAAIETVPKEYNIVLLDYETMTKQDLRMQRYCKFYSSTEPDAPRLFKLLIGTQNYITQASTKFQSLPTRFHLSEGYPNPFNAATNFRLDLPQSDLISITIYDLLGRKAVELMDNQGLDAGTHHIRWNGKNQTGEQVSSGIYLVLFKIRNSHTVIRKVVLVK